MRGFADSSTDLGGGCICGIIFLTGASKNHNDSFPFSLSYGGGEVSRSPGGLFAQQEREPTRGRPAVGGKRDLWWAVRTTRGGAGHLGLTHAETQRDRLWTACGQRRVDGKNSQTTPATTSTTPIRQLLGAADAQNGTPRHIQHSPGTPTTGLRERGNDTSRSTGRSGRQNTATRRNMRREERVTVQGPVKEQPEGMSHRGDADGHRRLRRERVQGKGKGQWREANRRRPLQTALHRGRHAIPPPPPPPEPPARDRDMRSSRRQSQHHGDSHL